MSFNHKKGNASNRAVYSLLLSAWMAIASFVVYLAYQDQLNQARNSFEQAGSRLKEFLDARLLSNEAVIAGFAAYLEISPRIDEARMTAYVKHILSHYSHIHAIAYMEWISETGTYQWHLIGDKHGETHRLVNQQLPSSGFVTTRLRAAKINDAVATAPFSIGGGDMAYAILQPAIDPQSWISNQPRRYGVLLVSAQKLLESAPINLSPGMHLSIHYGDHDSLDNSPSLFSLNGSSPSYMETVLLPEQVYKAKVGGPGQDLYLHLQRQLSWRDMSLGLLVEIVMVVVMTFSLLAIYTRALYRSEKARIAMAHHYEYQALHDPLTDLPNRLLIADRLNHAIETASRKGSQVAILFLDLDKFKAVNDNYGHETGDELLKAFAERLESKVRRSDTVGRISGDEFIILFEGVHHHGEIEELAEKLKTDLCGAYLLKQHVISIGYSMGLSYFPEDGSSCTELLRTADHNMYKNKKRHKSAAPCQDSAALNIE